MQLTTTKLREPFSSVSFCLHKFINRNFYVIHDRYYQTLHIIFESLRSPVIIKKICTNILINTKKSASALFQRAFHYLMSHTRNVRCVSDDQQIDCPRPQFYESQSIFNLYYMELKSESLYVVFCGIYRSTATSDFDTLVINLINRET